MTTPDNRQLDSVRTPSSTNEVKNSVPDSSERLLGTKESMSSSPQTLQNALKAIKDYLVAK